jgi:hypothetical protein
MVGLAFPKVRSWFESKWALSISQENSMSRLYVTQTTFSGNAIVVNVIEFNTRDAADLAFTRLKDQPYVSVVKLY